MKKTLRNYSLVNRIADMRKQITQLEKTIAELAEKVDAG